MALLAALVGLGAVAGVQARANGELRSLNGRLERRQRRTGRREGRGCSSGSTWRCEAIQTFHTGVSEDFLLKEDKFKDLRDRLLKIGGRLLR